MVVDVAQKFHMMHAERRVQRKKRNGEDGQGGDHFI